MNYPPCYYPGGVNAGDIPRRLARPAVAVDASDFHRKNGLAWRDRDYLVSTWPAALDRKRSTSEVVYLGLAAQTPLL